jgi:hypothetical protein
LSDQARDNVLRPASGEAYDDAHWSRRIGLCPSEIGSRQKGSASRQVKDIATGIFHVRFLGVSMRDQNQRSNG